MSVSLEDRGDLAIVLHSHMPYVEGFGTWPFGEEWLLEAIAACYLPLIELLERWAGADHAAVATVGVTPVLCDQLVSPEVGQRFLRFMRETRAECHRLDIEGLERSGQSGAADALRLSARDYQRAADQFEQRAGDLLGDLGRIQATGTIELWTSAATHAVLPLLETEAGLRLQVRSGIESHRARFGGWSGGFWLPECAYREGLDMALAREGVRAFCIDQSRHFDSLDQLEPVAGAGGTVALPVDWQTISLVWDPKGYPAHGDYRDYHAPTINGMRPWSNDGRPYDREVGLARARAHAREFVDHVASRLETYRKARGRRGLCVCALDTELLGHWWYEGPEWLDAVAAEAAAAGIRLVKLPEALADHEPVARLPSESSWGVDKSLVTWDSPAVAELRWAAATCELRLTGAAVEAPGDAGERPGRAGFARAARELLALQSSDWAFMETRALADDYPRARVSGHRESFERALAEFVRGMEDFATMRDSSSVGHEHPTIDAELGGLAPQLALATLTEPASGWGRESL